MLLTNDTQREFIKLTMELRKRFCYYVSETPQMGNKFIPCIVVENSPSKYIMDYDFPDYKTAKREVDISNKSMGLRDSDVAEIIATSIAASIEMGV